MSQRIATVLARRHVAHASLFGSFARGTQDEDSDLDLLVDFDGHRTLLDLVALKLDLEEVMGCRVDVVIRNALHPEVRARVLQEQEPVL